VKEVQGVPMYKYRCCNNEELGSAWTDRRTEGQKDRRTRTPTDAMSVQGMDGGFSGGGSSSRSSSRRLRGQNQKLTFERARKACDADWGKKTHKRRSGQDQGGIMDAGREGFEDKEEWEG
jgi:hypothetical protein